MWTGLSPIAKPTEVERDDKAFEYDTGKVYLFNGTSWVLNTQQQTDIVTGAYKTTESDHTANHLGYGYKANINVTNLAAGQTLAWCWTAPSTLFAHLKNFSLSVLGSSAKLEILKGATVTLNEGINIPLVNTNDNSTSTAQSTLRATPTFADGVVWDELNVFVDATAQNIGSAQFMSNPYEELVTKTGSVKYIFRLTNTGTDAIGKAWIRLFFYEEPYGLIE